MIHTILLRRLSELTEQMLVITRNMETDEETEKTIDWSNPNSRRWFANHVHWALCSGYGIQASPIEEEES